MAVVAIEWADRGIDWADENGGSGNARNLEALLRGRNDPSAFLCNRHFTGFDRHVLADLSATFKGEGHALVETRRPALEVFQAAGGLSMDDDFTSAAAVVARAANAIDQVVADDFDWHAVRAALDVAHSVALAGSVPSMASGAAAALGPWSDLDDEMRAALGAAGSYDDAILDAVARAAAAAPHRPVFERYLTLTNAPITSQLARTVRTNYRRVVEAADLEGASALSLSEYRRALRHAYGRLHAERRSATA